MKCYRNGRWFDAPKYIVSQSKLLDLMKRCEACGGESVGQQQQQQGAYAQFIIICTNTKCQHEETWETSSTYNQKYIINILLAVATLFSGSLVTKFLHALSFINIQRPSVRSFFRHQSQYLHGVSAMQMTL